MIGSASGSCFWMIGGSTSGGTFRIAPATFSRTVFAASSRSRSSRNRTVMLAVPPALTLARSWSMPAMPLSAFSIGMMTAEVISSGAAPGSRSETLTVAGSALRKQIDAEIAEREDAQHHERHDQHRGEDRPADAEFRQHGYSASAVDGDLHAVGEIVDVGQRDASPSFTPPRISMRSPTPIAGLQLVGGQPIAVDGERAIDAVAVLHRGVGNRQDLLDERGFEMHPRERAGLQPGVGIGRQGLEGERPRLRVDGRADPRHRAGERRAGKRVDLQVDRLSDLDPRRHALGNLRQHFSGSTRTTVITGICSFTSSPSRHHPLLDVAVERRPDGRVAQLAIRELHGGGRGVDVRAQVPGVLERGVVRRRLQSQRRLRIVERLLEK